MLKNERSVVLAALKRKQSQLSSVQEKIFAVNSNAGVAISGLTTDGSRLVKILRDVSIQEEFVYDHTPSPGRLAYTASNASQVLLFLPYADELIKIAYTAYDSRVCK